MYKIFFAFAAVGLLALSADMTQNRSNQMPFAQGQAAGLVLPGAQLGAGRGIFGEAAGAPSAADDTSQELLLPRANGERDGPAPALVVYLACILIGSAVGVGLVRRGQRRP